MLLLEHHGKALLRDHGIATPRGVVVGDEAALIEACAAGGGQALKAQVVAGGRGKAGGIVFISGAGEALSAFRALREKTIGGHKVETVLVEERIVFTRERYAAIQVENGRLNLLFAARGGVDIETISAEDPNNVRSIEIDVLEGLDAAELRQTFGALGFSPALWSTYEEIARKLFALARASDAVTAEINPLVETADGQLVALDARIFIDDMALARQPEFAKFLVETPAKVGAMPAPRFKSNPDGGEIGLIGFGSGLNITFMDWIADLGGGVATLVDIDAMVTGGHGEAGFAAAFEHMEKNPQVRASLLCIISCGNRMDDVVSAMIAARRDRAPLTKPVIHYLRGNRMPIAQQLLDAAGLVNSTSLTTAIAEVVAAAKAARP